MTVFVDTWGWLALHDVSEPQHLAAQKCIAAERVAGKLLVTSDFVLDETFTLLYRRLWVGAAEKATRLILESEAAVQLRIVRVDRGLFDAALTLRRKYNDKPLISLTDFTSMAVMKSLRLRDILTADQHFEVVGMAFHCVP